MDSKHYLPPRGQCGVRLRRRRPGGEGEEEKAGVQPTSSVTDVERLNLGLPCGMLGGASGEKTEKQMERNGDDRLGPSHRQITDTGSQYRVQPTRISTPNETDQEHECAKKKKKYRSSRGGVIWVCHRSESARREIFYFWRRARSRQNRHGCF